MQSLQDLKTSVGRIEAQLNVRKRGTFSAHPQSNPKGQHEVHEASSSRSRLEQIKSVTTLHSEKVIGKEITKNDDKPEESLQKKSEDDEQNDLIPHHKIVAPFLNDCLQLKREQLIKKFQISLNK